jgi:hypothetical protein
MALKTFGQNLSMILTFLLLSSGKGSSLSQTHALFILSYKHFPSPAAMVCHPRVDIFEACSPGKQY